jgi:alpha-galactosidase
MPVRSDEDRRLWILRGRRSAYALGVDAEGRLLHLHHGPSLDLSEELEVPGPERPYPFDSGGGPGIYYEWPAWGGMYYWEPCLKVTFADGVHDARLLYESHESRDSELVVALRDPVYPLAVRLHYRMHEEEDLVERWAEVENSGEEPVVLEQVLSAVWYPPRGEGYRLTHLAGKWIGETRVFRDELTPGRKVIESRKGNTSHDANPFFAVEREATGEAGEVWFGALAWSGSWKVCAETGVDGFVQVSGGINDFDSSWLLEGGETFETPAFVGGYTAEGFGGMSRALHRHTRERVLPDGPGAVRPVLYNSWEATHFDVTGDGQSALAERAARIGAELFVVDDGWFGARNDDRAGLGDWYVNREKFPDGLEPLIRRVRSLGMDFGIWVEPEMVNPDSDLYRKHPNWVYHFPTRPRTESRNQLVLNLARDDVREHLVSVLDRLLSENEILFVKWDMNRPISEPGWSDALPGREREVWVRHTLGVYEVLDRLRERHPGVAFEACSGGGGRLDLGILSRSEQVWTSDNTDPYERLFIQEGFSLAYPARAMMCWVTDKAAPLSYRFHSAMMGSLGVGGDLTGWSGEELEETARLVEQYKEIRDVVQNGDQYRLLSPREGDTTAVQYVSADRSEAVIFVLRNPHRFRDVPPTVRPRGLKEDVAYGISEGGERRSGADLMGRGITVPLRGDLSSAMLLLREERS